MSLSVLFRLYCNINGCIMSCYRSEALGGKLLLYRCLFLGQLLRTRRSRALSLHLTQASFHSGSQLIWPLHRQAIALARILLDTSETDHTFPREQRSH